MSSDSFDLGVDLDCYRYDETTERNGIVFYARPDTPRRGFEIGMLALELFARENPTVEIHLIGQDISWHNPTFRYVNHGSLSAPELAAVYNRCSAGLVLSLTNLSLLPSELLASGCVPVMNDAENTRASFDNPHARFVAPRPDALADALTAVVRDPDRRPPPRRRCGQRGPPVVDARRRPARAGHPPRPPPGRRDRRHLARSARIVDLERPGRSARYAGRPESRAELPGAGGLAPPFSRQRAPATPTIRKNTPSRMVKLMMSAVPNMIIMARKAPARAWQRPLVSRSLLRSRAPVPVKMRSGRR